jgi:hypothetical protein
MLLQLVIPFCVSTERVRRVLEVESYRVRYRRVHMSNTTDAPGPPYAGPPVKGVRDGPIPLIATECHMCRVKLRAETPATRP